jgi:hypothetical protein
MATGTLLKEKEAERIVHASDLFSDIQFTFFS